MRYRKRDLSKFKKPIQVKYREHLEAYEEITAAIAAEFYCYNRKTDFRGVIESINKLYSEGFVFIWEGLPKWKKNAQKIDVLFASIENDLNDKLDVLDNIHRAEYVEWQRENSQLFAQKQKMISDRRENKKIEAKLNQNARAIAAAKEESIRARIAARDAEARAAAAESAARDAEARAADAESAARAAKNEAWQAREESFYNSRRNHNF